MPEGYSGQGQPSFAMSYENLKLRALTVRDYLLKCQTMAMFAGKGGGHRNVINSAELFNRLNPYFISVDFLTLFPDTELYKMAQQGSFVASGQKNRIRELQIFINKLNRRTHLFAHTV